MSFANLVEPDLTIAMMTDDPHEKSAHKEGIRMAIHATKNRGRAMSARKGGVAIAAVQKMENGTSVVPKEKVAEAGNRRVAWDPHPEMRSV